MNGVQWPDLVNPFKTMVSGTGYAVRLPSRDPDGQNHSCKSQQHVLVDPVLSPAINKVAATSAYPVEITYKKTFRMKRKLSAFVSASWLEPYTV